MSGLAELLLAKGLVRPDQMQEALLGQQTEGVSLGKAPVDKGLISEQQLVRPVAEHFSYSLPGRARFRVNIYRQRERPWCRIPRHPVRDQVARGSWHAESINAFAALPRGFVLVTGPTGSGKSTTLAALVDLANRTRRDHIMTVEDPIEFLHRHKSCIVNQREVGEDTHTFSAALKHVLRQDPYIILVDELRDLETIQIALTAAETGLLVFATSLAAPLENRAVFPSMVVQMMAVGEDTGALDTMLHKISEFYDDEVEATTEALTQLIEPLMIAVVGGMTGAMIIAIYMPIFKVFDLIQ